MGIGHYAEHVAGAGHCPLNPTTIKDGLRRNMDGKNNHRGYVMVDERLAYAASINLVPN
jgi:hypothetical protein